jgi:hypothetical protein
LTVNAKSHICPRLAHTVAQDAASPDDGGMTVQEIDYFTPLVVLREPTDRFLSIFSMFKYGSAVFTPPPYSHLFLSAEVFLDAWGDTEHVLHRSVLEVLRLTSRLYSALLKNHGFEIDSM